MGGEPTAHRREALGFVAVGLINLGVEVLLFNLLRDAAGPVAAKVVATTAGSISAFFMNRYWTFAHRRTDNLARELTIFAVSAAAAIVINAAVVGGIRYGLDVRSALGLNIANLLGIAAATVFRFVAYKYWVFAPSRDAARSPAG